MNPFYRFILFSANEERQRSRRSRFAAKQWLIIIRAVADYTTRIRRHLTEPLLQALADTLVVLLYGARQTAKNTLVQSADLGTRDCWLMPWD